MMVNIRYVIELIFSLALFINALIFIPQIITILRKRSAKDVSALTFSGFFLIQFAIVLHGIINHDRLLVFGYLLSMLTCGSVVFLIFLYKNRKTSFEGELSLEEIIQQMPGHFYWKNKDGILLGCNTRNWKDLGFKSLSEVLGKKDDEIYSKQQAIQLMQHDTSIIETGEPVIIEEGGFSGNKPYLSHKAPLRNKNGLIIGTIGVSIDITVPKQIETDRLEFLENIIALMPGHVYWKNKEGVLLGCNDLQAKSAGLSSREDIVGKTDYDMPWKDQADVLKKIDLEVMNTGIPQTIEEISTLADGSEAVFLSKKVPLYNKSTQLTGILGISFDVTEQRKAEKALLETQNKLEGMTLVSASIAHELRTPLGSLNLSTSMLSNMFNKYNSVDNGTHAYSLEPLDMALINHELTLSSREIKAALTFIDMLLLNLNPTSNISKIARFSINNCIDDALSRYPYSTGKQSQLVRWVKDPANDFEIKGEPLLVTHVLFNLLKNALYYVIKAGKGDIQITLEKGSPFNKLYFKDTGTGIPADFVPHVFERFASKTYHGAGVGLTFCQWVMENLGGKIVCESVEGDYTLFILSFPNLSRE